MKLMKIKKVIKIENIAHMKNLFVEIIAECLTFEAYAFKQIKIGKDITITFQIDQKNERHLYFVYEIKKKYKSISFEEFMDYLKSLSLADRDNFMHEFGNKIEELNKKYGYNQSLFQTFWNNI